MSNKFKKFFIFFSIIFKTNKIFLPTTKTDLTIHCKLCYNKNGIFYMDKQTKRELKKRNKQILRYLLYAAPILLVIVFLLYYFVPSLVENQWVVIMLVVAIGGILYFVFDIIGRKRAEKKAKQPKEKDPYAD